MKRLNDSLNQFVDQHMPAEVADPVRLEDERKQLTSDQVLSREISRTFASLRWFR